MNNQVNKMKILKNEMKNTKYQSKMKYKEQNQNETYQIEKI